MFFSDGIPFSFLLGSDDPNSLAGEQTVRLTQKLIDAANRASVVVYTVDPRGLLPLTNIRDDFSGRNPSFVTSTMRDRGLGIIYSQRGLRELAENTGGFFSGNNNDVAGALRRVVDDLKGYYLIGYRPDESTFDPATGRPRFHSLKVRLKRSGLHVRSRSGFIGVSGKDAPLSRDADIIWALVSPFAAEGVRLRLTPLFSNDPQLAVDRFRDRQVTRAASNR